MTTLEIDKKLARFLHPTWYLTTVTNGKTKKTWKQFVDPKENELVDWNPSEDMRSAWEVAEHIGLIRLESFLDGTWLATCGPYRSWGKTAPLAICQAAIEAFEGSKSDE
ncbi:hypothetical protein P343_12760 [Sporolactobacillus laevolacticus DSM 442]|uniref:Phage ABA sandwich domain-containing protein n=2 Tax=Sporolactobacillus laevolacticus TaxID=33018 RepID=V6IVL4_9BACL|nr:hypothetical protein P343_12760 [Sporolactobacillus laevolacticus DSM 442]